MAFTQIKNNGWSNAAPGSPGSGASASNSPFQGSIGGVDYSKGGNYYDASKLPPGASAPGGFNAGAPAVMGSSGGGSVGGMTSSPGGYQNPAVMQQVTAPTSNPFSYQMGAPVAGAQSALDAWRSKAGPTLQLPNSADAKYQAQYKGPGANRFEGGLSDSESRLKALLDDPSSIDQSAAYKFRVGQGQEALQRQQAAMGMLGSGNRLMELTKYGQDMASQEYDAQFGRLKGLYDTNATNWNTANTAGLQSAADLYKTDSATASNLYNTDTGAATKKYETDTGARTAEGQSLSSLLGTMYNTDFAGQTAAYNTDKSYAANLYKAQMDAASSKYNADSSYGASIYGSNASMENAQKAAEAAIANAQTGANASMYGANKGYEASIYGTNAGTAQNTYNQEQQNYRNDTQLATQSTMANNQNMMSTLNTLLGMPYAGGGSSSGTGTLSGLLGGAPQVNPVKKSSSTVKKTSSDSVVNSYLKKG